MPAAMPAEEEEDEQPVWQSVAMFCCKGVIEGIIVFLFFWLLIQVLFTKELEIHLQVLLGVGLVVFCLSLLLGCFLCLWRMRSLPAKNKEPPACPAHLTSSSCAPAMKVLSEEPEGEGLDYPSAFGSSAPSYDDFSTLSSAARPCTSSVLQESPTSCFPLRRLSSPTVSAPLYRPMDHHRPSLPSLPLLSFLSRTRKVLERRCTMAANSSPYSERSRLTVPSSPVPTSLSRFHTELSLPHYGTGSALSPALCAPSLHFSLCFSAARQTLTLVLLSLSGAAHRLGTVSVLARLPPARPVPCEVSARHRSLSPELHGPGLVLPVSSLEELCSCVLELAVFSQDPPGHTPSPPGHTPSPPKQTPSPLGHTLSPPGHTPSPLGQTEVDCGELDWEPETALTCRRQLRPLRGKTQGGTSHDAVGGGLGGSLQSLPQLFILMQYQILAHRVKVMVLKAENLPGTAAQEHHVVINLRHAGVVMASRATEGAAGRNTVWNSSPFLFELPRGDVTQLPLIMEFILIKGCLYSTSNVVGRIVIGQEAKEEGQAHWRDMCNRSQVEVARWHVVQSETL